MSAPDQLSLDVEPVTERCYVCCGMPCGELAPALTGTDEDRARAQKMMLVPWPHAADCSNPMLGGLIAQVEDPEEGPWWRGWGDPYCAVAESRNDPWENAQETL